MDDFSFFKPICVEILKTPSPANISKLRQLVCQSDPDSINQLQEYILFPLFIVVSNPEIRDEKTIGAVGECLQVLCQKSTVKVYKIFSDFLLHILLLIHDIKPSESEKCHSSEEMKLVAVNSVSALLRSASLDIIRELLAEQSKPLLGHLVFTLLKLAAYEEMKDLRLSALDCLMEISKKPVDDLLALSLKGFFPGICTHMLKTINGSIKQSRVVTQKGVSVFSNLIGLIMNNQYIVNDDREAKWLQQTRVNLHSILEKVMNNPELHWKVKMELISMIARLIEDCSVTLEPSLPLLIKKLVQFTADERPEVEQKARHVVQSFSENHKNFDSAVRQNLYDVVSSLPRIISQGITRDQSLILQELQGHLTLLGSRLEESLMFSGLRQRLFKGLLISAALVPARVMERDESFTLQYLREDSVVDAFCACCRSIGRFGSLGDTADYFLDVLRQKDNHSCESIYVMMNIINASNVDLSALTHLVQEYSIYLTELGSCREDVLFGQLLLQVIGNIAKRMQGSFATVLLSVLKPVLEKAGHPDFTQAGVLALQSIAESLGLNSISELLENNADYFAPQLSYQLRSISRYPRAIDLLRALLLLSDIKMDHWLERMVQQALKGLDKSHTVRALPYIQVLELFCRATNKARPAGPACAKPLARDKASIMEEQNKRMAAYDAFIKSSEEEVEDESSIENDDCNEVEEAECVEDPIPTRITLVADILDRCTQLLPQSQEDQMYSSLIYTIHLSIDILWSRENLFLPKVHLLWEPLKNQMTSSSALKQRQAFGILSLLIRRCPDFIRQRVVTEVLQKLVYLLEVQSVASRGRSSMAHISSQAYKLQKVVLSEMGTLVEFLDPPQPKVDDIIQAISPYLSSRQVPELQILAKENLLLISKYHQESVRLAIQALVSKQHQVRSNENCEFSSNVEEIVGKLSSSS